MSLFFFSKRDTSLPVARAVLRPICVSRDRDRFTLHARERIPFRPRITRVGIDTIPADEIPRESENPDLRSRNTDSSDMDITVNRKL